MAGLPGALLLAGLAAAVGAAAVDKAPLTDEQNLVQKHHSDIGELTISHIETDNGNLLLVLTIIGILLLVAAVAAIVCVCLARRAEAHEYAPLNPFGKDTYVCGKETLCQQGSCLESIARSHACHGCHYSKSKSGNKSHGFHHHGRIAREDSVEICSECSKRNLPTLSSSDTHRGKKKKQVLRTEISLTKLGCEKPSKECAVQVELEETLGPGNCPAVGNTADEGTARLFSAHQKEPETPETALYSTASVAPSRSDGSPVRSRSAESGLRRGNPPAAASPAKESAAGTELPIKRSPSTYQVLHVTVPHQFKSLSLRTGESKTKQGGSSEFQLTKGEPSCEDDASVLLRAADPAACPALDLSWSEERSTPSEFTSENLPDPERLASDSQSACSSRGRRELRASLPSLSSKEGDV